MADENPVEPWPMATVDDLKARWQGFPVGADDWAEILLEDASQFIIDMVPEAVDASESTRRRVVCAVVRRSMAASETGDADAGMESYSETTGPFQNTWKFVNPNGDFYLTGNEKRALGHGKQKAFSVNIAGDRFGSLHTPWCSYRMYGKRCSCGGDIAGFPIHEVGA